MTINPILPIWLMSIICVGLLFLKRKGVWGFIRQIIIVILIFLINLRIMIPGEVENVGKQERDLYVLFVVDDTISMVAQDYNGSEERLTGVKETVCHIADELEGAKFGMISFHNTASRLAPFTDNTDHIKNVVNSIYPIGEIYAHGSSLNVPHDTMLTELNMAYQKADGAIAVFFISDGEITNDEKLRDFSDLKKYINGGAVLGFGTTQGGNMYLKEYYEDEPKLIEDPTVYPYAPAVSKIDEYNLNAISKALGIDYIHVTKPSDVDNEIEAVKRIAESSFAEFDDDRKKIVNGATDIYYYFAIPLLAMLVLEGALLVKRKRK